MSSAVETLDGRLIAPAGTVISQMMHHVQQDEVWRLGTGELQRHITARRHKNPEASRLEDFAQHIQIGRNVIHDTRVG